MVGQVFEKDGKKYTVLMKDVFYYATAEGVPCYFQPETGETIPRNKFCELLMDIQNWFWYWFGIPEQFEIVIHKKTITRQEIQLCI